MLHPEAQKKLYINCLGLEKENCNLSYNLPIDQTHFSVCTLYDHWLTTTVVYLSVGMC